ncbi:MAG: hypothetical protein SBU_001202 [Candidatus Syntrophoarchaeum butanivorans]|uniref:Uncharacterized protein n=1 Tax=Candidatus Syntropharchaeum butanivorans TaxID=1839936 RepID=A0A1F2P3R8_9EURY|nr:MAG: hypothetical protein SBU_001202 [Candidatus Syntrophoarchaeum butanivorans]
MRKGFPKPAVKMIFIYAAERKKQGERGIEKETGVSGTYYS